NHSVYVYRLELSPAHQQRLLHRFIEKTTRLEKHPEFYNTLFHNCTNELTREIGFGWNIAFVITGKSVDYLYRRGLIQGPSVAAAKSQADITDWLRAENSADKAGFDAALLTKLGRASEGTAASTPQSL